MRANSYNWSRIALPTLHIHQIERSTFTMTLNGKRVHSLEQNLELNKRLKLAKNDLEVSLSGTQIVPQQLGQWTLPNANKGSRQNLLIWLVTQYATLEARIAHLRPEHLVPLAQTCQPVHKYLNLNDENSRANLLVKTLCTAEDPGLADRRWWAGHILLFPLATSIFPPSDSQAGDPSWHLPIEKMVSHHDSGPLHLQLRSQAFPDPEPVANFLNKKLVSGAEVPCSACSEQWKTAKKLEICEFECSWCKRERFHEMAAERQEAGDDYEVDGVGAAETSAAGMTMEATMESQSQQWPYLLYPSTSGTRCWVDARGAIGILIAGGIHSAMHEGEVGPWKRAQAIMPEYSPPAVLRGDSGFASTISNALSDV
ncbi:hypothetical protein BCR34DRAFT_584029 [Clohesyomyces aquaticus]|uniref:Uncharacterized protein n=1 Tax=Clohesyomyces aquaticus TaxID=1231657 RepID=A0A1Y2A3V6_9PLEO|nr:hypothetical protein BCR34DRAFT_584029 [Clohesyomyces aquaticus]